MGLNDYPDDVILMQASVSTHAKEHADWARPQVEALVDQVKAFAGPDRLCPWLYLNYAHDTQKVLESYGPSNLQKIRDVAAKYDPQGVFQRLWPGGFKISAAKL